MTNRFRASTSPATKGDQSRSHAASSVDGSEASASIKPASARQYAESAARPASDVTKDLVAATDRSGPAHSGSSVSAAAASGELSSLTTTTMWAPASL